MPVIDVASQSLANPYGLSTLPPELYETLWWYSGNSVGLGGGLSGALVAGANVIQKGSTSTVAYSAKTSAATLFTMPSTWPASTQFAFEAAIESSPNTYTCSLQLWDITANNAVANSLMTTNSNTFVVSRSSKFTLTPGHQYGITMWVPTGSANCYITDASLIIFPNQQLLAQGSLSNITLGQVGQKLTEAQIPLWVYSSGSNGANSTPTSAGTWFIQKGTLAPTTVSAGTVPTGSAVKLLSLSSNWSPSQRFALEASINANSASNTSSIALYDLSVGSNNVITASQASATGATFTVVRSGSFTLTPGHAYAITGWCTNTGYGTVISKAHLVPLFT